MIIEIIAIGLVIGIVVHVADLHIAIYRPRRPGRRIAFMTEIGDPVTSIVPWENKGNQQG